MAYDLGGGGGITDLYARLLAAERSRRRPAPPHTPYSTLTNPDNYDWKKKTSIFSFYGPAGKAAYDSIKAAYRPYEAPSSAAPEAEPMPDLSAFANMLGGGSGSGSGSGSGGAGEYVGPSLEELRSRVNSQYDQQLELLRRLAAGGHQAIGAAGKDLNSEIGRLSADTRTESKTVGNRMAADARAAAVAAQVAAQGLRRDLQRQGADDGSLRAEAAAQQADLRDQARSAGGLQERYRQIMADELRAREASGRETTQASQNDVTRQQAFGESKLEQGRAEALAQAEDEFMQMVAAAAARRGGGGGGGGYGSGSGLDPTDISQLLGVTGGWNDFTQPDYASYFKSFRSGGGPERQEAMNWTINQLESGKKTPQQLLDHWKSLYGKWGFQGRAVLNPLQDIINNPPPAGRFPPELMAMLASGMFKP